jgi:hypothetical protein
MFSGSTKLKNNLNLLKSFLTPEIPNYFKTKLQVFFKQQSSSGSRKIPVETGTG